MMRPPAPPSDTTSTQIEDARAERRVFEAAVAVVGTFFAVATTTQSVMALGIFSVQMRAVAASPAAELVARGLINLGTVAVMLGMAVLVDLARQRPVLRIALAVLIALAAAVMRAIAQVASGLYPCTDVPVVVTEIATTTCAALLTLGIGLAVALLWRRQRSEQRQRERNHALALAAHDELRAEEIRIRREVAQELHGTVQGALVIAEAHVHHLAANADGASPVDSAELAAVAESLRVIRDEQLRRLTSRLFPADLDRGVEAALDALVARLPASIAVEDGYRAGARALDARATDERPPDGDALALLLVHIAEEGVTNAVKHGAISRIRIGIHEAEQRWVEVTVADDGVGIEATAVHSGLARLSRQALLRGGALVVNPGGIGERGSTLRARLPLD
ncbi:sensor histidine kinase [Microbacterium trichothecenolyticum]|uniref:histidine kinase n=1 Tax=Microbacterium trichothecenolyticum TaxID=69370 RepID=A0ABU0TZ41_MICTR|nr:ATP-binding protein [Microbacterium trichothecenolyticum]MDQ1124923.1 two-component system sensor histidine kinase UhpB [Microbacterium trichothecenolyticum]